MMTHPSRREPGAQTGMKFRLICPFPIRVPTRSTSDGRRVRQRPPRRRLRSSRGHGAVGARRRRLARQQLEEARRGQPQLVAAPVDDRQGPRQPALRVRGSIRTATRVPAATSRATVGSGRIATPDGISTARLMFSMLSNSSVDRHLHVVMAQEPVDGAADRQVGVEGHELLAVAAARPRRPSARRIGATGGRPGSSPPHARGSPSGRATCAG